MLFCGPLNGRIEAQRAMATLFFITLLLLPLFMWGLCSVFWLPLFSCLSYARAGRKLRIRSVAQTNRGSGSSAGMLIGSPTAAEKGCRGGGDRLGYTHKHLVNQLIYAATAGSAGREGGREQSLRCAGRTQQEIQLQTMPRIKPLKRQKGK